jgi:ACS family tartrate transporter-like MFS transporter
MIHHGKFIIDQMDRSGRGFSHSLGQERTSRGRRTPPESRHQCVLEAAAAKSGSGGRLWRCLLRPPRRKLWCCVEVAEDQGNSRRDAKQSVENAYSQSITRRVGGNRCLSVVPTGLTHIRRMTPTHRGCGDRAGCRTCNYAARRPPAAAASFPALHFCYLDRTNVSIAALQMNSELRFSSTAFGLGAGIFFIGYALFEVPSNLILARVGARHWLARIAITWGLLACAMMWVRTPTQFYVVRFLLGVAEAGFFPGVIYYLSEWFPTNYRARAISGFVIAIPLSQVLGSAVGGAILGLSGIGRLSGWQWLFLIEGLPSVCLGVIVLAYLTERPDSARWLSLVQRDWLSHRLEQERQTIVAHSSPLRALGNPLVWVLAVPYFAYYTVALAYVLWAPTLVRDALGTSNTTTGLITASIALLAALAYPLAGMASDRWDGRCTLAALGLALECAGCIGAALFQDSVLRVASLVVIALGSPLLMTSFWCLPTKFLKGASAAAGIAFINAIGSSGGFFGPSILGFLKQTTGSDYSAFLGLAGLALVGSVVCIGLRQMAVFKPSLGVIGAAPAIQRP